MPLLVVKCFQRLPLSAVDGVQMSSFLLGTLVCFLFVVTDRTRDVSLLWADGS